MSLTERVFAYSACMPLAGDISRGEGCDASANEFKSSDKYTEIRNGTCISLLSDFCDPITVV
jgi:hypothetical protein